MKRRRYKIGLFFISLCILLNLFGFGTGSILVCAEEELPEEELNDVIQAQIELLDLKALQEYVDALGVYSSECVAERIFSYIKTGSVNYEGLWMQVKTVLFAKIREIIPAFACICAITLLSGLIALMRSGSNAHTTADMIFLLTYMATLIPLFSILSECVQTSLEATSAMQTQMQLIFPLMLTLMAASGGNLTASVCRPAVGFFATNIVSVIHSVVFPITVCIFLLSTASNLTKELRLSKFTTFFKGINKWIIGICISAFGIFFTLQGITAVNYDGIVRRAAKYAIGNGIPIVGGFLSGGFDLAVAGSVLIKNSLGSMSIFLMLAVIFEPLVLLISVNVLLRLTAAITQPFGDGRISDFLEETAGNLHYCTAGLLFIAFLYFLSIMLMICASEALF